MGAELYGHAGIESDVEVLCLMLEALAMTGLHEVHLDFGHVGIFRGLAREAELAPEQEAVLFEALQRKSRPEIEVLLSHLAVSSDLAEMLLALTHLNGAEAVLGEAGHILGRAHDPIHQALDDLQVIARTLRRCLPRTPLHFDLAELRGYRYHTGVVFAGYVPGCGQAVAQGGRYDDIGRVFGRARPATGFSSDLRILAGLQPDAVPEPKGVFAPYSEDSDLQALVEQLRARSERVICGLPGQFGGARELGCDREIVRHQAAWQVRIIGGSDG
jgi:ATP phosphoribosyltransferase regulatory subunit